MISVIATCWPCGNFEKIVTTLQRAGLDLQNETFVQWHDKVFGSLDTIDPLEIDQQSLQELEIEDNILAKLSEERKGSFLMADHRCLWLLDFWAAKLPEAKFLLFYTHVDSALAYACLHGIAPQQAIDSWQVASRQLLKFHRYNRRRTLLLDADAAIRQPGALVDVCCRIGITLHSLPTDDEVVPDQADLARYLAQPLVSNQPGLQALEVELEASAQPIEDGHFQKMQPLDLFNQHSQWLVDYRKTRQELDETVKKLQIAEYALEQQAQKEQVALKEFKAKLNQLTIARDEQVKLNNEQEAKLASVQREHQELREKKWEISEENDLLILQLHQVQEELEKIFFQKQPLEQEIQLLETTKNATNHELRQIKDDLLNKERKLEKQQQRMTQFKETVSWKITAPIRLIGKPFKKWSKEKLKTQEQIKELKTSGLFDEAWYTATNEDVVKEGYDPVEHYIRFGAAEGRDPSPVFNTQRYLECNPDVADSGMNPLVHYVKYGMAEKRYLG